MRAVRVSSSLPPRALQHAFTPVLVRGSGFVNASALRCRFGMATSNASLVDNSTLVCAAPFFSPELQRHVTSNRYAIALSHRCMVGRRYRFSCTFTHEMSLQVRRRHHRAARGVDQRPGLLERRPDLRL